VNATIRFPTGCLVGLLLLVVYLLLTSFRIDTGDGETVYQVTRSMVNGQGVAIPAPASDATVVGPWGETIPHEELRGGGPYGAWGFDGRYYAQYGIGQSLLALPLYVTGRAIHGVTSWGTEGLLTRTCAMLLNPMVLAATGSLMYAVLRGLGYTKVAAACSALSTGLATPLIVYSKTFFSEPTLGLMLTLAVWAVLRSRRDENAHPDVLWRLCGGALGFAILTKLTVLVVVPIFGVYAFLSRGRRWRKLFLLGVPIGFGLAGVLVYNTVRFGSPLETGYRTVALSSSPLTGLVGLFFSSGKGLLWYCPVVLLSVVGFAHWLRHRSSAAVLILAVVSVYTVFIAWYSNWPGGGAWGARHLVPLVPLMMLPSAEVFERTVRRSRSSPVAGLLLGASLILQMPAVLVSPARTFQSLYTRSESMTQYVQRLVYSPADSPLLGQWRSLLEVFAMIRDPSIRSEIVRIALTSGAQEATDPLTGALGYLAYNSVDVWPVHWSLLGAPVAPTVAAVGLLVAVGGWLIWRLKVRLACVSDKRCGQ